MEQAPSPGQHGPPDWQCGPPWHRRHRRFPWIALFVLALGVLWLGNEAHWWVFDSRFVWPLLLICVAVGALVNWATRRRPLP